MVDVVSLLPLPLLLNPVSWSQGWQPPGTVLNPLLEPSELSLWLFCDKSTINCTVTVIFAVIVNVPNSHIVDTATKYVCMLCMESIIKFMELLCSQCDFLIKILHQTLQVQQIIK